MTRDDSPKNTYKVPRKVWNSWTVVGKNVFNKLYEHSSMDQYLYRHPDSHAILPDHWDTTAWNHAFQAACICSRGERHLLKQLKHEIEGYKD